MLLICYPLPPPISNFTVGHTVKITVASAFANLPLVAHVICERSHKSGSLKWKRNIKSDKFGAEYLQDIC